ncbi:MAG: endo-1,4-beta-xylanase, partial [Phycisphaerae bacterium]|nr:endo-1,4-beta-xylanase [Phycisphaerae bacterium]
MRRTCAAQRPAAMPILFEIYRDGQRLAHFTPVNAVAVGPESVPIPGEVKFENGLLSLNLTEEHAVAVSLLWEVAGQGVYHMETTRLQPRPQPYNLNVELARCRLMKIVQKQEDWNLFDFPRADQYALMFRQAQEAFSDALGRLHEPGEAAKLADRSLSLAVDLSEQLANFHGELLLNRRRANGAIPRHVFGCRVDSTIQNQRYKDTLTDQFDFAVLPMSWRQLQPEEDTFVTEPVDEWVEQLSRKRVPIIAGPLVDLSDGGMPDWSFIWEHDFDTLRELAYEFVQKVVHRYRKAVSIWNVVAGLHTSNHFTLTFEQIIELTRLLVAQVKTLIPSAQTLVTITQPYGEYHARGHTSVPPMLYADMVAQAGVNFDGFGLELETGVPRMGSYTRDLFQFSSLLDRFSTMNRRVYITAISAPDRNQADPSDK